jgi:flagellin
MVVAGPNGVSAATSVAGKNALEVAQTVNTLGTGVTAEAKASVQLSGFTAADTGTLEIGDDSYDLSLYNGSMSDLAAAIGKDGHSASYDSGTGKLDISAKDVAGIKAVGPATGTLTMATVTDGVASAAATVNVGGVVVNAALSFSSSEAFSVTGTVGDLTAASGTSTLSTVRDIDISQQDDAQSALAVIDAAIAGIDSQRADLGAVQNRMNFTISNLSNIQSNVTDARSRIQDVDFASETAQLTKQQILSQTSSAMLAQANQIPQTALSLL